jgi:hypothetical protein
MQAMRAMTTSTTSVKQSAASTFGFVFAAPVTINFPVLKADGTIALMVMDPKNASDMQAKLKAAGLPDADGMGAAMKASIDQDKSGTDSNLAGLKSKAVDSNGNVRYDPPSTSTLSSLQQAKVMVNFLREALNRFSNSMNTGYLNKQQARIDSELKDLVQPSVERTFARIGAMQLAVQLYNDASAGLVTPQISNGKTYYLRTNGSVNEAAYGGNYTMCSAEKASNSNAITVVTCTTANAGGSGGGSGSVAAPTAPAPVPTVTTVTTAPVATGGGVAVGVGVGVGVTSAASGAFSYLPSSSTYNGISSNSQTNTVLVGLLRVASFKITPTQEAGTFNYGLLKQSVAVTRNTSDPSYSYSIPEQKINIVSGPYNYDVNSRLNTLDSNCVSPTNSAVYVNTSWSDISGSKCAAFVGTGTITQTLNGSTVTGIALKGTMPPSDPSNTRQIGYDNVQISYSATDLTTTRIDSTFQLNRVKNTLSGYVEAYETPVGVTSVNVDSAKVVKIELADGSYLNINRKLTNSNFAIASNVQEGTLKISFTAINTKGVGTLTANDWVFDKNGYIDQPKTVIFDGTLSDISNGGGGDILKGKLTMNRPNYQLIDSRKPIGFGNDDGASMSFIGSVNAKQSSDYIKASLNFTRVYSAPAKSADSLAIKLEIAGGFVLEGSALGDSTPGSSATIKLKNQDGIILSARSDKNPIIYASDEKTELGTFKDGPSSSGGSAFYFIDGSFLSLY